MIRVLAPVWFAPLALVEGVGWGLGLGRWGSRVAGPYWPINLTGGGPKTSLPKFRSRRNPKP